MIKVILADDAKFIRNMIKRYLDLSKYEVIGEATNGIDLIKQVEEKVPNFVISDITMSELDGVEAMKIVKKKMPGIKFLICSARMDMKDEALEAGAEGFLLKPFDEECFLKKIDEVMLKDKI